VDTSAEARVIASFTFLVALLLGAWSAIDNLITGPSSVLPDSELGRLAVASLPLAATAVAFQATTVATAGWARVVGGAAVMLGVLASVGGVLYFLANT
jgi:hypothetical protein